MNSCEIPLAAEYDVIKPVQRLKSVQAIHGPWPPPPLGIISCVLRSIIIMRQPFNVPKEVKDCPHAYIRKAYYLGLPGEDYVCVTCG